MELLCSSPCTSGPPSPSSVSPFYNNVIYNGVGGLIGPVSLTSCTKTGDPEDHAGLSARAMFRFIVGRKN